MLCFIQLQTSEVLRDDSSDGAHDGPVETRREHRYAQTDHDGVAHLRIDVFISNLFYSYLKSLLGIGTKTTTN